MDVILREDVEKLGTRGQVVKVASGYARNFLLPKSWPSPPPNRTRRSWSRNARPICAGKPRWSARPATGQADGIVTVTISQKAGENDQLFGSVTSKDIADALEKQGYTIERRKIALEEPIKSLGEFKVPAPAASRRDG